LTHKHCQGGFGGSWNFSGNSTPASKMTEQTPNRMPQVPEIMTVA
jgi:hypothetical protein